MPEGTCKIEGCDRPARARGWCIKHYERWRRHGDPLMRLPMGPQRQEPDTCSIEGCERPISGRGWCRMHYKRWLKHGDPLVRLDSHGLSMDLGPTERFWLKVNKAGPVPEHAPHLGPCWLWTAHTTDRGYGDFHHPDVSSHRAHVVAYELTVGPVPQGLELDHLCRVHACVNPAHLEPVTGRTNVVERGTGITAQNARKTHCKHGHEFTPENTYVKPDGRRRCRICIREEARLRRGKR